MNVDTAARQEYEETLINIARILPPTQVGQLVDFARFLEAQTLNESLLEGEDVAQIEADDERWDELLASDRLFIRSVSRAKPRRFLETCGV